MNAADDIERIIGNVRCTTSAATDERILADATAALTASTPSAPAAPEPSVRNAVRTSMWTRVAVAAGLIAIAGVVIILVDRSASTAYALGHTLEANRDLRSFHARRAVAGEHGPETSEIWLQIDDEAKLVRLRMDLSHADGGPKVVVWRENVARVWFPERNLAVVVPERGLPGNVRELLDQVDPNVTMQFLHDASAAGRIEIEIIEPSTEGAPVQLVSTFPDDASWKDVYLIDPETSLVRQADSYSLRDGAFELARRIEYLDYNQPPDSSLFALDLPEDATLIDQTAGDIGLARGDMTDEAIAVRVAREFCEAVVAGDHARAGRMFEGVPAEHLPRFIHQLFGAEDIVRIVSIGSASRDAQYAETAFLCVPCEVEVLLNGGLTITTRRLGVRPVHERPDHWTIAGTCDD